MPRPSKEYAQFRTVTDRLLSVPKTVLDQRLTEVKKQGTNNPRVRAKGRRSGPAENKKRAERRERQVVASALPPIEPPAIPAKRDIEKSIKLLKTVADPYKVSDLTTVTEMRLDEAKQSRPKHMTVEEKLAALEMWKKDWPVQIIAARLDRDMGTVKRFLADYQPTVHLAKAVFEAKAEALAHRIVKHADVDQSMEVLTRIEALPASKKDAQGVQNAFQIIVGTPGNTDKAFDIPIPTQATIAEASEE